MSDSGSLTSQPAPPRVSIYDDLSVDEAALYEMYSSSASSSSKNKRVPSPSSDAMLSFYGIRDDRDRIRADLSIIKQVVPNHHDHSATADATVLINPGSSTHIDSVMSQLKAEPIVISFGNNNSGGGVNSTSSTSGGIIMGDGGSIGREPLEFNRPASLTLSMNLPPMQQQQQPLISPFNNIGFGSSIQSSSNHHHSSIINSIEPYYVGGGNTSTDGIFSTNGVTVDSSPQASSSASSSSNYDYMPPLAPSSQPPLYENIDQKNMVFNDESTTTTATTFDNSRKSLEALSNSKYLTAKEKDELLELFYKSKSDQSKDDLYLEFYGIKNLDQPEDELAATGSPSPPPRRSPTPPPVPPRTRSLSQPSPSKSENPPFSSQLNNSGKLAVPEITRPPKLEEPKISNLNYVLIVCLYLKYFFPFCIIW